MRKVRTNYSFEQEVQNLSQPFFNIKYKVICTYDKMLLINHQSVIRFSLGCCQTIVKQSPSCPHFDHYGYFLVGILAVM